MKKSTIEGKTSFLTNTLIFSCILSYSLEFIKTNEKAGGFPLATIIGTVLFTAASGVGFALLRHWSGSIIAPMILHYSVNSGSFLASWYTSMRQK